ncbi:uncharacterized protein V6R79_008176 [Siganus canaliculatus]
MLLCRSGRLSAAVLDQSFKSAGSYLVQVKANRLKDVTLTLHKHRTLHGHRRFCVSVRVDSNRAHPENGPRDPQPAQKKWDSLSGFVITEWKHLDRVSAVAVSLSKSVQSAGGNPDILRSTSRRLNSSGEALGDGLFTGNWDVSCRPYSTSSMQTRAASTKRGDAGEGQAADSNKGEEQNLKEAFTTSSSTTTGNAAGPPEPEGGKLTKTQQLKKVFKEYGAVGVSFHVCISLMSLGMFYLLVSSGIDMAAVLCKLGFSESVVQSKMAAGTSTFVLAYAVHKLFAPVRISITLVSVPLIVRYFRKTGLFKPPTPAP